MTYSADELERVKAQCASVSRAAEGAITYFVLEALRLPPGATPAVVDAMLRIGDRGDGYATRLYLAEQAVGASKIALNWNAQNVRILEKNWHAYSWKAVANQPLDEILVEHLRGLQ